MSKNEIAQGSYKELKKSIKEKPINILLVSAFLFFKLKKRWNAVGDIIYLIDTNVISHPLQVRNINDEIEFKIFGKIEECDGLIKQRMSLEKMNSNYLNNVISRFNSGDNMIAIYTSGNYLSSLFVSTKKAVIEQVSQEIKLNPNQYCIYDVYTIPEFRKKGFYEIVLSKTIKYYYNNGYNSFLLWVMNTNHASKLAHNKLSVNNVIRIYSERFIFGFRKISIRNYKGFLSDFIN